MFINWHVAPQLRKYRIYCEIKNGLTFTRKKWTPKVGRPLASLTYWYLASISDVPINFLCSTKIFFSMFFCFMKQIGRNSLRLQKAMLNLRRHQRQMAPTLTSPIATTTMACRVRAAGGFSQIFPNDYFHFVLAPQVRGVRCPSRGGVPPGPGPLLPTPGQLNTASLTTNTQHDEETELSRSWGSEDKSHPPSQWILAQKLVPGKAQIPP